MSATLQQVNAEVGALCGRSGALVERLEARCGIREDVEPKPRPKLTVIQGGCDG